MSRMNALAVAAVALALASGCTLQEYTFVPADAGPMLTIRSPSNGRQVELVPGDGGVLTTPIAVEITGFRLAPIDGCSDDRACGHVHYTLDNGNCRQGTLRYGMAFSERFSVDFSQCPMIAGSHTIKMELHHDEHTLVEPEVSASVQVMVPPQ